MITTTTPTESMQLYKVVFPKARNRWVAKPILENKSYHFVADLMAATTAFKTSEDRTTNSPQVTFPSNIAKLERPPKEHVIQSHISRLHKPK